MMRSLMLGATALALSGAAASAQTVYVQSDYAAPAYVALAPVVVAPAPAYVAPPAVVSRYYAVPQTVTVGTPVYGYASPYVAIGEMVDWD